MDSDADGIHAAALPQIFFHDCMPVLLEQGRLLKDRQACFTNSDFSFIAPKLSSLQSMSWSPSS